MNEQLYCYLVEKFKLLDINTSNYYRIKDMNVNVHHCVVVDCGMFYNIVDQRTGYTLFLGFSDEAAAEKVLHEMKKIDVLFI